MFRRHRPYPIVVCSFLSLAAWAAVSCSPRVNLARAEPPAPEGPFKPSTSIKVNKGLWELNGKPTYAGAPGEGLLFNARMVNAVFEDRNPATCPKGFDPEKNADAFIARIPEYVGAGVRAFTINLQGGPPGYENALNSAFEAGGSLRPDYMKRVARVIEACDRAGAAVILGFFDAAQDQVLKDDDAVKKAVAAAAGWVRERGYTNVLIEVASDIISKDYDRSIISDYVGMVELIKIAKQAAPGILVSASGGGGGRVDRRVATVADFLLIHFDNLPVEMIAGRAAAASKVSKAIVCNEDSKTGEEGARALQAASDSFVSWGYSNVKKNQTYPFKFEGTADDPPVYAKLKELTTPAK